MSAIWRAFVSSLKADMKSFEVAEDSERLSAGIEECGRSGKMCVTIATTTNLNF